MGDNYSAKVGNKGRIVIPAGLRESKGWTEETVLLFVERQGKVELISRDDLLAEIREQLRGESLVDELISERRAEARRDDEETAAWIAGSKR